LEYGTTGEEARHAKECLRLMERKWEVVNVDVNADKGKNENLLASCLLPLSQVFEFKNKGISWIIQVGCVGVAIVHGMYCMLLPHSAATTTLDVMVQD
jgi:hypothetical protein